jgi:outer membrane receptor protein involved in Fe transport
VDNNRNNTAYNLAIDAVVNPANGQIVCRSTLTNPTNGCQPLNLFGQYQFSPAAKAYVYGQAWQTLAITQHVLAANLRGEPFSTWAGPVSFAVGGEYRHERGVGDADPVSKALAWQSGNGSAIDGKIGVLEGYAETVVPLAKDMAFAKSLELNAAIRGTRYTTSGTVLTWKVGGVWDPTDWLKVRATRSRDVRAPNFNELFAPTTRAQSTINDQFTRNQGVFDVNRSGNPDLAPEKADTLTAGVVFAPKWSWARGFNFSVDYYKIKVAGAIATEVPQNIVTQCFQGVTFYCGYVTRGPDQVITLIRAPYLNLNSLQTDGFDIEGQYNLPLSNVSESLKGNLNLSFLATYVHQLKSTQSTGVLDIAGVTGCAVTSTFLCVPHWTLDATIAYDVGPLSVTLRGHYIPKSTYDATLIGPEDPGYSPFLTNSISSNRVGSATYLNLGVQYNLINHDGQRMQVFGAIENLTDKNPPANQPGRGNNVFFDPVGRYYKIGLRLSY